MRKLIFFVVFFMGFGTSSIWMSALFLDIDCKDIVVGILTISIAAVYTSAERILTFMRTKRIEPELTGKVAEKALVSADITVNKNMVPFDSRSAFQTSGIRLGTPAITTRGAKEDLMIEIAEMIETVLSNVDNEEVIAQVRARVNETMKQYPIFAY